MSADPLKWSKALPWAEYWYNTSYHISAAMTPFKALYGHDPPTLIRSKGSSKDTADLQSQLAARRIAVTATIRTPQGSTNYEA